MTVILFNNHQIDNIIIHYKIYYYIYYIFNKKIKINIIYYIKIKIIYYLYIILFFKN